MQFDEKACPYCGEAIKKVAIKCKHCGSNLDGSSSTSSNNSGGSIFGTVVLILICFGLYSTNPTKTQFTEFVSKEVSKQLNKKNELGDGFLKGLAQGLTNMFLDSSVREDNYYLFKVFTIDFHLFRAFNAKIEDQKFIGIAGQFIPLNGNFGSSNSSSTSVSKPKTNNPPPSPMPSRTYQTSFDCTKARSATEIEVCTNQTLANLDISNANLYNQAKQIDPGRTKDILINSNQDRRACNGEFNCIRSNYENSMAQYRTIIN